jgi:hypothetical protein
MDILLYIILGWMIQFFIAVFSPIHYTNNERVIIWALWPYILMKMIIGYIKRKIDEFGK